MAREDNTIRNATLGLFLGPLAGAYFGYQYAKQKQELYTLDPNTKRGWDSPIINAIVGVAIAPLSSVLFGINSAKLETKIEDLKLQPAATGQRRASSENNEQNIGLEASSQKWRDHVAQASQQTEIVR